MATALVILTLSIIKNKADSSLLQGKSCGRLLFHNLSNHLYRHGANFQRIQEAYKDEDRFHLVSHTVMPEIDTVEDARLRGVHGAIKGKWHLLTGEKWELYRMARREYFAVMEQGTSFDEHDFIHTENVILVDEKKRIRGFYDGTSDLDIDRLIGDIQILLDRK